MCSPGWGWAHSISIKSHVVQSWDLASPVSSSPLVAGLSLPISLQSVSLNCSEPPLLQGEHAALCQGWCQCSSTELLKVFCSKDLATTEINFPANLSLQYLIFYCFCTLSIVKVLAVAAWLQLQMYLDIFCDATGFLYVFEAAYSPVETDYSAGSIC